MCQVKTVVGASGAAALAMVKASSVGV